MLSLRLLTIADMIPNNSKIINIGTDHALLEIYLTLNKNVHCLGLDINLDCVLKALNNVKKYNLNQIKILQNDGLNNLKLTDEIIILSGLGTRKILQILNENITNDLIIQSNNNLYELRQRVCKKGYHIEKEIPVFDKKWYVIIYFKKGYQKYSKLNLYIGPTITNKNYKEYLIKINQKMLKNINKKQFIKKIKKYILIKKIGSSIKT
ncbi:MAG: tRNA (adenine(22)-N(1))-methyltransferase TrmK [Bacilli bacterium]